MDEEEMKRILAKAEIHYRNAQHELWEVGKVLDEIRKKNGGG